ncbi:MAG: 23S rRNA (pseudouridine(1915)-N(3))-methyltransferase RlmH [Acidobacteriaceae bacterium]|jgi:23S rRNA (pseudouridine1915-N3)-methyltransferase
MDSSATRLHRHGKVQYSMGRMEIQLVTLGRRTTGKHASAEEMYASYCQRITRYCGCQTERYASEEKFFAAWDRASHARSMLVLLDHRGRTWSSETFAQWLQRERDGGIQQFTFAVGPADGWSEAVLRQATSRRDWLVLSLGPMTLPHELAAVVLAEQIYRAFTIVEGHPYHLGH